MSGVVLLSFNVREFDLFTNVIDIREIKKFVESSEANRVSQLPEIGCAASISLHQWINDMLFEFESGVEHRHLQKRHQRS